MLIYKVKLYILFLLISALFLNGCSTKFLTTHSEKGTILYVLEEKEAFKIAHHTILSVLPGRKITIIDGATKGYSTYFRFLLDTYTQQILVFPASGINRNGKKIFGYYYEVSGSGSSFIQGRAKNIELYETLNKNLQQRKSAVIITNLKNEAYSSAITPATSKGNNIIFDNLERLKELYDKGILTEKEYNNKKSQLLNRI